VVVISHEETTAEFKGLVRSKVENQVWETIFKNWGEILTRESNKVVDICPVCGNNKEETARNKAGQTVCETTEFDCKESKTI
jgi:hypothetical protein